MLSSKSSQGFLNTWENSVNTQFVVVTRLGPEPPSVWDELLKTLGNINSMKKIQKEVLQWGYLTESQMWKS